MVLLSTGKAHLQNYPLLIYPRLVATVGKGSQRRLNRKLIQGVNVPKACEKIIDPGAPLALRLQGNLLYGVSRVFAHQCNYVLSDAEKTQSDMMTFFRTLNTNETDPKAGKTKYVAVAVLFLQKARERACRGV